jgi:hypothetical protein
MATLTVSSFLSGARNEDGKSILHNPFFNPFLDRYSAERQVIHYRLPVIRNSSYEGFYAVTYICYRRRGIVHTLLRQNADNSVDVLDDRFNACEHYADIYTLLDIVLDHNGAPPTPRGGDSDPTS